MQTETETKNDGKCMPRELAYFLLVLSQNMSGRVDPAGALKSAQDQLEKIENHGNNCWIKPKMTHNPVNVA